MKLSDKEITAIEQVLMKGDRAEIIPTKDGVKIIRVNRKQVKVNNALS